MTPPPPSDDSGEVNPPPYNCLEVSDGKATAAERAWDSRAPRSWRGHKYHNLVFCCTPKVYYEGDSLLRRMFRRGKAHPHWRAELLVVARNIPNLMRHGFHISRADLIPGAERVRMYYERSRTNTYSLDPSWEHGKTFFFKHAGPSPEWTARLEVFTQTYDLARSFELDWVTADTVIQAFAYHWDWTLVYNASPVRANTSFNIIFDRLPMGGWWPVPKEMQTTQNVVRFWNWTNT